jgi:ribosome-associated protein
MQDDQPTEISKTRRKREMHELQELGQRLVDLNKSQVAALDLPEDLREAVADAQIITKHEARRRHMQYIGRLMRSVDPEPIREKLREWDGQSSAHTALLHRVERWRDRLIEDENGAQEFARELGARGAQVNWQALRTQAREARLEREQNRPPRHYRELFRSVRALMESKVQGGADDGDEGAVQGGAADQEEKPE